MSLLFITAWIHDIERNRTPWDCLEQRCMEDPRWTCYNALREIYENPDEAIPPYLTNADDKILRRRQRGDFKYRSWQCTEITSVNDRIRIYK